MPRNRGYRSGNESDKGLPENRRDPRASEEHAQEVFYTEGSQDSIPMKQMSPGGPPDVQDPGPSQDGIDGPHHIQDPGLSQGGLDGPPHIQDPGLSQGGLDGPPDIQDRGLSQGGLDGPPHIQDPGLSQGGLDGPPDIQDPGLSQGGISGPPHMQDPGLSQGQSRHYGHPYYQPNGSNAPGHFAPQSNVSHEHNVQYPYFPHDQVAPGYNYAPHAQVITRDANTPIKKYITPSIESIIAKRVLTVAVLIFNETLNWLQYSDWKGTIDLPPVFGQIGKKSKADVIECSADAPFLPSLYGVFCGFGTVYALFQIINTIGETVLEYHARKSGAENDDTGSSQKELSENSAQPGPLPQDTSQEQPETDDGDPERQDEEEPKSIKQRCASIFYGFQLLHGWVETVAAMVVEDLPQLFVAALSSYYCTVNLENAVFLLIWMAVKELKNKFRKAFCKHKYTESACDFGDCFKGCCTYTCPLPCCCLVCVCSLCHGADEQCFEIRPFKICPDCKFDFCSGPSNCDGLCNICGPKDEDPEWAIKFLKTLESLAGVGWLVIIALQILGLTGAFHASI